MATRDSDMSFAALHAQPTWKVVAGGSHTYIPKLTAPSSDGIHERAEIHCVRRSECDVTIAFRDRPSMVFDDVVFACHGDQVLPLLADPGDRERDVFASFTTTTNAAWLHTDGSMLPARARRALRGITFWPPTPMRHRW